MKGIILPANLIIKRESLLTDFITALTFLAAVSIFWWRFDINLLFFWVGGLLGVKFLDLAENIFRHDLKLSRPVFHTLFFQIILIILSFYVISSSGNYFGAGLVMVMNLQLLKDQTAEFIVNKTLSEGWLLYLKKEDGTFQKTRNYLILILLSFLTLTVFLIRQ